MNACFANLVLYITLTGPYQVSSINIFEIFTNINNTYLKIRTKTLPGSEARIVVNLTLLKTVKIFISYTFCKSIYDIRSTS